MIIPLSDDLLPLKPRLVDNSVLPEGECMYRIESKIIELSGLRLSVYDYPIIKRTNKGVWIDTFGRKRFILTAAICKWAYPTKKQALSAFQRRKQNQIIIVRDQLSHAQAALDFSREISFDLPAAP